MIWNEEDVIDVAKDKIAIQSSISRWSKKNDASRACDSGLNILDHAFHTSYDENPWWMVDLGDIFPIEVIRVSNRIRFKERAKTLRACLSLDGENWTHVDNLLYAWDDKLEILEINIAQFLKARFVKLFLNEKNYLHLKKVEIFIRKYPGYIVTAKYDGFGMRIESMIISMLLAKKTGFKFRFVWPETTDGDQDNVRKVKYGVNIEPLHMIFSEKFIQDNFLKNNIQCVYHSKISENRTFEEFLSNDFEKPWGWYNVQQLPSSYIENYSLEECISDMKRAYFEIGWSSRFTKILESVKNKAQTLGVGFIALHLRGGELIYSDTKLMANLWAYSRHFPYEVAIDIIFKEINKKNNVLIFGQDKEANKVLRDYFKNKCGNCIVEIIEEFMDEEYVGLERDFFELNFLAHASSVISTPSSSFSRVSDWISGKIRTCSYMELYSREELFGIMQNNINVLNLNNLQKAYSYYRMFVFGIETRVNYAYLLEFIQKSANLDPTNYLWRIYVIDTLFILNEFNRANLYIKKSIEEDYDAFFKSLFLGRRYNWALGVYNKIDEKYFRYKDHGEYIMLVHCKILQYAKHKEAFDVFFNYFKDKLNNKLFQKVFFEFEQSLKYCSAKKRFENHLSFQLGRMLLENSKSLKNMLKIPFLLYSISKKFHQNHNLKSTYSLCIDKYLDYDEGVKVLKSQEYEIGKKIIAAHRNWYKGGYIIFLYKYIKNRGDL